MKALSFTEFKKWIIELGLSSDSLVLVGLT